MNKNIDAAQILGVNKSALQNKFKERQISDKNFNNLSKGKFEPYFPSEDIQERFAEIARNIGDPNVFLEVRPTLRLMFREFGILPLTGAFDSELNDFLFEEISPSPLPQQPMPSPAVVQTAMAPAPGVTNQGLTPIENALLSEEEKQIRLRQRGLV